MSPNYISTILSTGANPNWDIAVKIARELQVSLAYLAGTSTNPFDMSEFSAEGPITDQAMKFFDQIAVSLRQAAVLRGEEPTIDDMMMTWYKFDRLLSGFEALRDWFDVYIPPKAGEERLEVLRMGSHSLAARTLGTPDRKALQYALDEVHQPELQARLLASYRKAAEGAPVLSEEYLDVLAPGHAEKIRLDYVRLLLPVRRSDDSTAIISYSKTLR